jgi:hypothetical protein
LNTMTRPSSRKTKRTGYDDFLGILAKFKGLSAAGLATGASIPFVAYYTGLAPPPEPKAAAVAAGSVELITLIIIFHFFRRASRRTIDRLMLATAALLMVAGTLYLTSFMFGTFEWSEVEIRGIRGFICSDKLSKTTKDQCPYIGQPRLRHSSDSEEVWIPWTVTVTAVILHILWLASFAMLSALVGSFLVYQTKVRRLTT